MFWCMFDIVISLSVSFCFLEMRDSHTRLTFRNSIIKNMTFKIQQLILTPENNIISFQRQLQRIVLLPPHLVCELHFLSLRSLSNVFFFHFFFFFFFLSNCRFLKVWEAGSEMAGQAASETEQPHSRSFYCHRVRKRERHDRDKNGRPIMMYLNFQPDTYVEFSSFATVSDQKQQ